MSDDYILELHRVVILCAILIHIHHSYSPLGIFCMSCPSETFIVYKGFGLKVPYVL